MEKKVRIGIIMLITIMISIIIQWAVQHVDYSLFIIISLILSYYYILLKLKTWIKKAILIVEKINDKIRGVDLANTESLEDLGIQFNKGYIYEGTRIRHMKPFFKENSNLFSFNEKIIDLGCGKGSALIVFKKVGFKIIAGVEISERICQIAEANLQKLKIPDVTIYHSDIIKFNHYQDFDIFYMFNPFPAEVLNTVVYEIEQSIKEKPRDVKIIYMNPKHHEAIDKSNIFNRVGEFNYDSEKSSFRKIFVYKN